MFSPRHRLQDFADTLSADSVLTLSPFARWDSVDAQEQMAQSDRADRSLLTLVACAAAATLVLALASSLGG
jgi:hypothetical protein